MRVWHIVKYFSINNTPATFESHLVSDKPYLAYPAKLP